MGHNPLQMLQEGEAQALGVVRVYQPDVLIRTAGGLVFVEAANGTAARRQVHFAGRQVPVPDAVVRSESGEGIALLALSQCLLRPPPLGDVQHCSADSREDTRGVPNRVLADL